MFALAFERSREFQQRIIIKSVGGHDIGDLRLALSQRSGLVEDDYLSFSGLFKRGRSLEQHSVLCAHTAANHYRDRGCKSEGARAADDKNAYCAGKRKAERATGNKPRHARNKSYRHNSRDEYTRHFIGDFRYWGFCCRGIFDHIYYLAERCILADTRRFASKKSVLIERSRADETARRFVNRYALASKRRFINRALAAYNSAVNRDALAWSDNESIAFYDFLRGYNLLLAVSYHTGGFRREIHEALYRICCAPFADGFKIFADGYKRQYHCRRLKIESVKMVHRHLNIAVHRRVAHFKEHRCTVHISCRASERH